MTAQDTILDAHSVRLERLLPGPVERVWSYLTDKEYLATWLADGAIEPRVGARYELRQTGDNVPVKTGAVLRGVVRQAEPLRKLTITWTSCSPDEAAAPTESESVVTFELQPRGGEVLLIVTHTRLGDRFLAMVSAGWDTHVATMIARLKGERPMPFEPAFANAQQGYVQTLLEKGFVPQQTWPAVGTPAY